MGGDEEHVLDGGMLGFSACVLHERVLSASDVLFRTEGYDGIFPIFTVSGSCGCFRLIFISLVTFSSFLREGVDFFSLRSALLLESQL